VTLARIKKGDRVAVMAGKDRGKIGIVLSLLTEENRVFVEKINRVKKHLKPSKKNPQGGILEKEAALHISNVMPVCPKCNKPSRVKMKMMKDKKTRVCHRCGGTFEVKA